MCKNRLRNPPYGLVGRGPTLSIECGGHEIGKNANIQNMIFNAMPPRGDTVCNKITLLPYYHLLNSESIRIPVWIASMSS